MIRTGKSENVDIKKIIEMTSYYSFYFGLSITIYETMTDTAYIIITGKENVSAMTFLFPLLCLIATVLIKRIGTLKKE